MEKWKNAEKIEKMKKCTARDATSSSFAAALRDWRTPHSYPQSRGLRYFYGKPTSRASIEPRSAAFVSALCRECCKLRGIGECCLLRCLMNPLKGASPEDIREHPLHKLQWITQSEWLDRYARLLGVTSEWFVDEVCGDVRRGIFDVSHVMTENTNAQVKLFQPTQHLLESCTLAMHVAVVVNLRFFSEVGSGPLIIVLRLAELRMDR